MWRKWIVERALAKSSLSDHSSASFRKSFSHSRPIAKNFTSSVTAPFPELSGIRRRTEQRRDWNSRNFSARNFESQAWPDSDRRLSCDKTHSMLRNKFSSTLADSRVDHLPWRDEVWLTEAGPGCGRMIVMDKNTSRTFPLDSLRRLVAPVKFKFEKIIVRVEACHKASGVLIGWLR